MEDGGDEDVDNEDDNNMEGIEASQASSEQQESIGERHAVANSSTMTIRVSTIYVKLPLCFDLKNGSRC